MIFTEEKYKISLNHILLYLLAVITLATPATVFAQEGNSGSFNGKIISEELFIVTDRDFYISGEEVWFKVFKINQLTGLPDDLSQVIYVELLDKNNYPLAQLKVPTDGCSASANLILPEDINSGNYFIRAYTRWMMNWPVDCFAYREVSVINPFEPIDNLKLPDENKIEDTLIIPDEKVRNPGEDQSVSINFNNTGYAPREKAKIVISAYDRSGKPVKANLSISIVKTSLIEDPARKVFSRTIKTDREVTGSNPGYLPELEGHIISGLIRKKITDEPIANIDLSLAHVGKTARCRFTKSSGNGNFNFVVSEPGIDEIVIQPLLVEVKDYYIELDQAFSSNFNDHKAKPLILDSSRVKMLNNTIISMQINNIYEPFRQRKDSIKKFFIPDFYGKPENTVMMSDYIELTSLREAVKEIIPNLYIAKKDGKYDFKLINKIKGETFENPPLLLVDGVPVYDMDNVLNMNSRELERADIINTRYFLAENVFDGIVSFVTKKGNLTALEFDSPVFRQIYEFPRISGSFYSPDYSTGSLKASRIPDYRNTLYWDPSATTGPDGMVEIEFFTSDEAGEYTIIVEGISADGKFCDGRAAFVVK